MRLEFIGAAHEVTGSCHYLEFGGKHVLVAAGERLIAIIQKNREGANKDLAKFADQINALCDKWER